MISNNISLKLSHKSHFIFPFFSISVFFFTFFLFLFFSFLSEWTQTAITFSSSTYHIILLLPFPSLFFPPHRPFFPSICNYIQIYDTLSTEVHVPCTMIHNVMIVRNRTYFSLTSFKAVHVLIVYLFIFFYIKKNPLKKTLVS